jgi:acid phosphatase family membrane protein YuiD
MTNLLANNAFIAAIVAGLSAQAIKVLTFLFIEKQVNYRRFVETDGAPNMHAAAFAALTTQVGITEGFTSIVFALALCVTVMASVDTWNVKRAASRQAELLVMLLDRISAARGESAQIVRSRKALSYTPVDVLAGTILGIAVTLVLF